MTQAFDVTLLYAGLGGFLLVALSFNIMFQWVRVTGQGLETDQAMRRAERVLSSFVEVTPLALLLLALIESRGAPSGVLHFLGGGFVLARLLHALGSNFTPFAGLLRFLGSQLSYFILMAESLACIYLFAFGV